MVLLPLLLCFLLFLTQPCKVLFCRWLAVYGQITQTGFYNRSDWLARAALARVQAVITRDAITLATRCSAYLYGVLSQSARE